MFWEHVPRAFMESLLRCVFDVYITADDHCGTHFETEEGADIQPFVRRALLEGAIRDVAKGFPSVNAKAVLNATGNWHHTRIICGLVAFTQNALGDPEDVVRPSLFRSMYAARDNQTYLIPELKPAESPPDSLLYGILVHGKSEMSRLFPGFADIVFPKPDLESYYDGRIELFKEFPDVVKAKTSRLFGTEETIEPSQPVLRARNKGTAE
jgi:hypothetical protein